MKILNSRWFSWLFFLLGLLLLLRLLQSLGWEGVMEPLRSLGWATLGLLGVTGAAHLLKVLAWAQAFPRGTPRPGYARLWQIRLAGEAFNYLTAGGALVGDSLKAALVREQTALLQGVSSIVMDRAVYFFSLLIYLVSGACLFLLLVRPTGPLLLALLPGCLLLLALAAGLSRLVRGEEGFVSPLLAWYARLRRKAWLFRLQERVGRLERQVQEVHREDPRRFRVMTLLNLAAHFLIVVEVYWILWAMEVPAGWLQCYALAATTKVIEVGFFFVPVRIGVFEAGNVLVSGMLGIPPQMGVPLALARRLFDVFWAGVGVTIHLGMQRPAARGRTGEEGEKEA